MALTMQTLKPECGPVGVVAEKFCNSKVSGTAHSRSTSAGSSSRDLGAALSSPYSAHASPYPAHAVGLPEYDYPTAWSIDYQSGLPSGLTIKNTFLGTHVQRPQSLEEFFEERFTQSCPMNVFSDISLPPGLEDVVPPEEAAARLFASEAEYRRKSALRSTSQPGSFHSVQRNDLIGVEPAAPQQVFPWEMQVAQPPLILDLMQALSSQHEASQPQPFDSQFLASALPPAATGLMYPAEQEVGSIDCPTVGSQGHWSGTCKPCAFLYTKGCGNGARCTFCHLCEPGEKKRRAKDARATRRSGGSTRGFAGTRLR